MACHHPDKRDDIMTERTILFATDYSDASQHALSYDCSMARDLEVLLLIAHVSEHELYPVGEAFDEKPEPSPQEMERLRSAGRAGTHLGPLDARPLVC